SAVAAGSGGFVINGQGANDASGWSVSGAGDVNGDGLADLVVTSKVDAGRSYVVFGRSATAAVDLASVAAGVGGFIIYGQAGGDGSGWSVSGAGDVNGDGLADLLVGAPYGDPAAGTDAGRAYVVFGRSSRASADLAAVAAGSGGGFAINGLAGGDGSGYSVSSVGDVNGDGLDDVIVGAPYGDPAAGVNAGRSYVVFGRSGMAAVELSAVAEGRGGFAIAGQSPDDASGLNVSGAGDVNGDGLADLMVSAPGAAVGTRLGAGRTWVIFGSTGGAFQQSAVDQFGTAGADALSDGGTAQTLVAGAGDDTLTVTAASVLHGGAGNDRFVIDATMVQALQAPLGSGGNVDRLARVDGGGGLDTIALSGAGLALDLTKVAGAAAGDLDGGSRIAGVERIDLTGSGDNTLTLKGSDVLDIAGFNAFGSSGRHQLLVAGDAGDTVNLADSAGTAGWTSAGTTTFSGATYAIWNHNTALATVYVASAVAVI
ncbi:VCBS repeat-containing protein, partial [Azohydromonas lata]|uniref:VCBS repeat-containing protein n=1 Tax=Azohydromonas lata TaxID=45677 RepID=UPI000A906DB1